MIVLDADKDRDKIFLLWDSIFGFTMAKTIFKKLGAIFLAIGILLLSQAKKLFRKKKRQPSPDPAPEISNSISEEYFAILSSNNSYFRELVEEEKQLFLKRVFFFRKNKEFHFLDMEEQPEIPLLISSVAVQITFGLNNYLLPFFKKIFVISDVYQVLNKEEWYLGHVAPSGIYISWKHFLDGFQSSEDNFNVAFHELAHAVHHENFIHERGVDWEFREDLENLSHVFDPILTQSLKEHKSYLRGYAFTNFYEFWAVSVEAFFENPKGLKDNLPSLYSILCKTLRQDPLARYKRLMTKQ